MPGRPFAQSTGSDYVVVKWTPPENDGGSPIDQYNIFVSDSGADWSNVPSFTSNQATYRLERLPANTMRQVYVTPINMAGEGPGSHVSDLLTTSDPSAPGTPSLLRAFAPTASTVKCEWRTPSNDGGAPIVSYELVVTVTANPTIEKYRRTLTSSNDQVGMVIFTRVVNNLQSGTSYTATCTSLNSAGYASATASTTFSTLSISTAPSPPRDLHSTVSANGALNISWTKPLESGGVSLNKYVVSYSMLNDATWLDVDVDAPDTTLDVSSFLDSSSSSSYLFRARAFNVHGASQWSESVTMVPRLALDASIGVDTTQSITGDTIPLLWTFPVGADTIVVKTTSNYGGKEDKEVIQSFSSTSGGSLVGLYAETAYIIRLFATFGSGTSKQVGPTTFLASTDTTSAGTNPSPPRNVRVDVTGSTSVTLLYDASAFVRGARKVAYVGTCATSDGNSVAREGGLKENQSGRIVVAGMEASTAYTCSVRCSTLVAGSIGGGISGESTSVSVVTQGPIAPSPPGRPSAVDLKSGSVMLTMAVPKDDGGSTVTGYEIEISTDGRVFLSADAYPTSTTPSAISGSVDLTLRRLAASKDLYFRARASNNVGKSDWSLPSPVRTTLAAVSPSPPLDLNVALSPQAGAVGGHMTWSESMLFGGMPSVTYVAEQKLLGLYGDACMATSNIPGYDNAAKGTGISMEYDSIKQSDLPPFARNLSPSNYVVIDAEGPDLLAKKIPVSFGTKYGAIYAYRVFASNGVGLGSYSKVQFVVSPVERTLAPSPPEIVQETYDGVQSANEVLLSWSEPNLRGCSPSKYYLLRHTKSKKDETWSTTPTRIDAGAQTIYRDAGLDHTTTYKWQLIAANLIGDSVPSGFSEETTTGKSKPTEVCKFDVRPTAMEVILNWDPPCDDGGSVAPYPKYQVQFWRKDYGGNWNHLPELDHGTTTYTHTFNREYFNQEFVFQVRATNTVGYGPWHRQTIRMLEPKVCSGMVLAKSGKRVACSDRGDCHDYDGTCSCQYEYAGTGCELVNGVYLQMVIEGSIETFDPVAFRDRVADVLGIGIHRVPTDMMTFEAGSIIVHFAVLEERLKNTTTTTTTATQALAFFEKKMTDGELGDLGATSLKVEAGSGTVEGIGSSVIYPEEVATACTAALTTSDPCDECLQRKGCGYCTGPKFAKSKGTSAASSSASSSAPMPSETKVATTKVGSCMRGGMIGPAIGTGTCPSGMWSYGGDDASHSLTCPMTPTEACSQHSTCGDCVSEARTNCAWCASSGVCLSQVDDRSVCPWGWVPDECEATCAADKVITSTKGVMWLGSNRPQSVLKYLPSKECRWTLRPIIPQTSRVSSRSSSSSSRNEFTVTVTMEHVDLGGGDHLKLYDATDALVREWKAGQTNEAETFRTSTGMYMLVFTSDASSEGTGFLARYEATPSGCVLFSIYYYL